MENITNNNAVEKKAESFSCTIVNPDAVGFDYGDKIRIDLAMTGIDKEDIKIETRDGFLLIESSPFQWGARGKMLLEEIQPRRYYKKFRISEKLDLDSLDATLQDGILSITVNYKEESKPRQITIN